MTWGSGIVERRLRYPAMRQGIISNLKFFADVEAQRQTLDYDTSMNPWSWEDLHDAIEDTFVLDRPAADHTIGIVLFDDAELEALCAVWDAIDHVFENERETFDEVSHAVTAPSWPAVTETARHALEVFATHDASPPVPTREVARDVLEGIRSRAIDARDASHWADQWSDSEVRPSDPILADALRHISASPRSGGLPDIVDPIVVAGWIDDLENERLDLTYVAGRALGGDWIRDELHAYTVAFGLRTPGEEIPPGDRFLWIRLIYWHTAGLAPLPIDETERAEISERVIGRLIESGIPEPQARDVLITFEDEAPTWPNWNR